MRKWTETVKPWPSLKAGIFYQAEVVNITKIQKKIEVIIRVLEKDVLGRTVSFQLPLPLRPDGMTADFFKACQILVSSGAQICPKETIGQKLSIQFSENQNDITALSFRAQNQRPSSGKEN